MNSTARKVVIAKYTQECVFKIPKGICMDSGVDDYWIKRHILYIKLKPEFFTMWMATYYEEAEQNGHVENIDDDKSFSQKKIISCRLEDWEDEPLYKTPDSCEICSGDEYPFAFTESERDEMDCLFSVSP